MRKYYQFLYNHYSNIGVIVICITFYSNFFTSAPCGIYGKNWEFILALCAYILSSACVSIGLLLYYNDRLDIITNRKDNAINVAYFIGHIIEISYILIVSILYLGGIMGTVTY